MLKNALVWPELSVAATPEGCLIAEALPIPQYRVAKLLRFGAFDEKAPVDEVGAIKQASAVDTGPITTTNSSTKSPDSIRSWTGGITKSLTFGFPPTTTRDLWTCSGPWPQRARLSFRSRLRSRPVFARRYVHIPMLSNNFCGHLPGSYVQWFQSRLNELFPSEERNGESPRRIYVSRSQASHRHLKNESEVQAVMRVWVRGASSRDPFSPRPGEAVLQGGADCRRTWGWTRKYRLCVGRTLA